MKEDERNRLKKIGNDVSGIGDNLNGNHNRSIKEIDNSIKNLNEVMDNLIDRSKQKKKANNIKLIGMAILAIAFVFLVNATINYNMDGVDKFSVTNDTVSCGNLTVEDSIYAKDIYAETFHGDLNSSGIYMNVVDDKGNCTESNEGIIVYENGGSTGNFYGCEQTGGVFSWHQV